MQSMYYSTLLTLFLGFLILFNSTQAGVNQGKTESAGSGNGSPRRRCTFRGKDYSPGEVWEANNASSPHCVLCSCLQSGKLNCTRLDCCDEVGGRGEGRSNPSVSIELENSSTSRRIPVTAVTTITTTSSTTTTKRMGRGEGGGRKAHPVCCETCGGGRGAAGTAGHHLNIGGSNRGNGRRSTSGAGASTIQTISHYVKDSSSHYDDEETDDDPLVKANLEHVSCLHQGKIYRDGEVFAANMSGLPISSRGRGHCMHCECQGGMVLCTMKPCAEFDCKKNNMNSSVGGGSGVIRACCDKCNAENLYTRAASVSEQPKVAERSGPADMNDIPEAQYLYTSVTTDEQSGGVLGSPITTTGTSSSAVGGSHETRHFVVNHHRLAPPGKRSGCISAGKFHFHGSTWHPIIEPFGPMECVICKCLHSKIECSRLPCASAAELQCYTLTKLEGTCCPTCAHGPPFENGERQLCVPAAQDVTVYKAHEHWTNNDTEVIRLSFVRVNSNPKFQVEIHEWTLGIGGKISRFFTTYLTMEDFVKAQRKRTFIMLGATSTRNLDKFTKREKKLHFRCKVNCNVRVRSLQLTLRLQQPVAKPKCSSAERNVLL